MSKQQITPLISPEEKISEIKIESILKEVSTKGKIQSIVCDYVKNNPDLLYEETISFMDIKKATKIKVPKVKKIIAEISSAFSVYFKEKNEYVPRMSEIEFMDTLDEFVKANPSCKKIIEIIKTDPDIMTGNTERFNKTAICRETALKTKKIEEILKKLKKFFVENEKAKQKNFSQKDNPALIKTEPTPPSTVIPRERKKIGQRNNAKIVWRKGDFSYGRKS